MPGQMPGWWWALVALGGVKALAGLPAYAFAPSSLGPDSPFPSWVYLMSLLAYTSLGFALILGGRRDRRAQLLGAVFVMAASMSADRALYAVAGTTTTAAVVARAAGVLTMLDPAAFRPLLVWMFGRAFPRDALAGWWRQAAAAGQAFCAGAGALLFAASVWAALDAATSATTMPAAAARLLASAPDGPYWLFMTPFTLAGTPLILLNMRAAGRVDRRRATVFVAGLVAGTAPILAQAAAEALIPAYGAFMDQPTPRFWSGALFYPLLYAGLGVAAYSVYVDQVLSVRLVVRRAVRYAFARVTLLGLMVLPFLLLLALLVANRDQPVGALLTGPRQVALVALVAGAAALLAVRRRLLTALDRQFFREQYDARQILASLIDSGRSASSLDALAAHLTSEIERALHVTCAALYVADAAGGQLHVVNGTGPPLSISTTLATLLKGSDAPMPVGRAAQDSPLGRLPSGERAWAATAGYELLVPVRDSDVLVGLIALGGKRSELPYSREDRWLLSSIASSAVLALARLRSRGTPGSPASPVSPVATAPTDAEPPAHECPRCTTVHPHTELQCPNCGQPLIDASVPLHLHGLRLERRIGTGGMGIVYSATDTTLHRTVAVKTLPTLSDGHARQLRREARAMAALSHPNLATIFMADVWRGTPILVVEYLHGGTLRDALARGPQAIGHTLAVGIQLAGALEHMHGQQSLHRDIKPSNIGFTRTGTPKLLDFGLARVVASEQTVAGEPASDTTARVHATPSGQLLIGTPAYFSPEMVNLRPPDTSSDLWALSLTLYEAIAGVNPLWGKTTTETMERIARHDLPALRTLRADCPVEVSAWFETALAPEQEARPATAQQLVVGLQQASAVA